jgi:transcriptional regulator with XRE-family HTH domain
MPRTRPAVLEERNDVARSLGRRLAAARESAGLSQAQAASKLGVAQSRIAKVELGTRQLQFIEGLRLADLYSISPAELDPFADRH